ncbi:MAG: hypothetical protein QNK04_12570 [Myxococcota bacterium]|nr:hypothetical protein [Myxococcota bacterium]
MAEGLEIPRFGELLQRFIGPLPPTLLPAFLAALERGAAERYRQWARECDDPERAGLLMECAASEDEIAARAEKLFPVTRAEQERIDALMPEAGRTYLSVFEPHTVDDQYRIQADAELQGAAAWRGIAESQDDPDVREALEAVATLEEASSRRLRSLLEE